jgi:hypothetical protein
MLDRKMLDRNAIVKVVGSKMGTGFLFGKKYILTCNHVVDDSSEITVQFTGTDGSTHELLQVNKVMGVKEDCLDYAVLQITEGSLSLKPLKASCLCLTDTKEMELNEGLFVQLAGHTDEDNPRLSFYMTPQREVRLGTLINNGCYLFHGMAAGFLMQDGFSGSPVLDIQTGKILGIVDTTNANQYTTIQEKGIGQMIRSDAIKLSLKEYDEQNETNFCDLLFTREEPLDTSYINDNYTKDIRNLAEGLGTVILFIGHGINLYNKNNNLDEKELERICDIHHQFNGDHNISLSEIELAYFLGQQIKKKDETIKCLKAEIPELKGQAIDQHSPCPSCPYELSKRPENCLFRLENDNQDQTNNQLSIEEQLMNAQVNVKFLSQYYIDLCGDRFRVIKEIQQFYDRSQPNEAHKLIAKYVKNKKIKLIITTNCDNLLERAFNSSPANIDDYGVYSLRDGYKSETQPLICLRERHNSDAPIILKLHGCYESDLGHNLLIANSDFSTYYSVLLYHHFENLTKQLLDLNDSKKIDLNYQMVWFIGYTLNDPDINLVVNIFKSGLWEKQKNIFYWVYCPSSSLNQTNRLWNEDEHLKLVPRTLESFFNDLEHFYGLLN